MYYAIKMIVNGLSIMKKKLDIIEMQSHIEMV